jgi:hypothetical protein
MNCQDLTERKFGDVNSNDFVNNFPIINSDTKAVILYSSGKISFVGNSYGFHLLIKIQKHIRIRILQKSEVDKLSKLSFIYINPGNSKDNLDSIKAATYNYVNGNIEKTQINKADLYTQKNSLLSEKISFAFPNLREGSIIEYETEYYTTNISNLPEWHFQDLTYPCLQSNFQLTTPPFINYLVIRRGVDSLEQFTSFNHNDSLIIYDRMYKEGFTTYKWSMKNITSFENEQYVAKPNDYIDKLSFVVYQISNGEDIINTKKDWSSITNLLLKSKRFGVVLNKEANSNLYKTSERVCKNADNSLECAKAIYQYLQNNFKVYSDNDIFLAEELYDINKRKEVTEEEINLLLIALLRQKDINAEPVILSTKKFGNHSTQYPNIEEFNYVICKVELNGEKYYLDATDPKLGFGKLPLKCFNGHARIISDKDSGDVYFLPDSIVEKKSIFVSLKKMNAVDSFSGYTEINLGYYESLKFRQKNLLKGVSIFDTKNEMLLENNVKLEQMHYDSLTNFDYPIKFTADLSFPVNEIENNILYVNCNAVSLVEKNPFIAQKRKFPIEFDFKTDVLSTTKIEIPDGFKIDELPASVRVKLNEADGLFEYIVSSDNENISIRAKLKINKTIFLPEDYDSIRDFYAFIIKKQSEQIVFKKIK